MCYICLYICPGVIATISKLTKSCILRLTPDNLFFVLSGKVTNGGVSMWCELAQVGLLLTCRVEQRAPACRVLEVSHPADPACPQGNFFDDYQMEGVSSEDNEICLEVAPENLSRALKTAQTAKSIKVKLTKKHCPCLTVAAELVSLGAAETAVCSSTVADGPRLRSVQPTLSSLSRVVTHDIPVDVIPRRLWHEFKEPSVPDFHVGRRRPAWGRAAG